MTVLVWGVPSEPPVARITAELEAIGADVITANPRDALRQSIVLTVGGREDVPALDGTVAIGGRRLRLADVSGAYVRPVEPELVPGLAGLAHDDPKIVHARRVHDALVGFTEVAGVATGCRVANRLSSMASNMSKPLQAQSVRRHGFSTPATLVTDDPNDALAFAAAHGRVVYKSTSGIRSIVTPFDPDADRDRLASLRWCPVQFQERIDGPDVRVHVVDTEVYAARIETPAVDYRYARSQVGTDAHLVAHRLATDIADRCVALAADLDLPFAGIDLKLAPDGRIVCFEVNPSPGFPWFETETGLPIAAAVARWLIGAPRYPLLARETSGR